MDGKKKLALTFAFYEGDTLVRRETVAQDIVKVGKDPKSHLRVDDEQASRMHAVIEVAATDDVTLIECMRREVSRLPSSGASFYRGGVEPMEPRFSPAELPGLLPVDHRQAYDAAQVLEGITAVVQRIRALWPDTAVLLLGTFPRGAAFKP